MLQWGKEQLDLSVIIEGFQRALNRTKKSQRSDSKDYHFSSYISLWKQHTSGHEIQTRLQRGLRQD